MTFLKHNFGLAVALAAVVLSAVLGGAPVAAQQVTLTPGASTSHTASAASLNPTNLTTSRTFLVGLHAINTNAATAYLKFVDSASAPTCGTTPVKMTYPLVQNVPVTDAALVQYGALFTAGMGFCITGALADADTTNATTGIVVDTYYETR